MTDKILTVPFYSQYLDIKDPHWIIRSCGITCIKMALDYFGAKTPDLDTMIKKAVAMGAYGDSGWYHDGLIAMANDYGVAASRKEDMDKVSGVSELRNAIAEGGVVVVSVVQRLLGRKKYHQVLLIGYREEGQGLKGFYYHDPASTDREQGKGQYVELGIFKVYWRRKAIFLKQKTIPHNK
jgi:hypothetical protein